MSDLFTPERLIALTILFLTSMPVHEWAHAWAAYQLGDDTAARQGRLTINPLAHLDPIGTLLLFVAGYGWGKPVPVNPNRFRGNRRLGHALVSLAGPFSNLVLAMLACIPLRLARLFGLAGALTGLPLNVLSIFVGINLSLMIFNLIPIPPLDGSRVLTWLLPRSIANQIAQFERYGSLILLGLIFLLSRAGVLSLIFDPVFNFMLNLLIVY